MALEFQRSILMIAGNGRGMRHIGKTFMDAWIAPLIKDRLRGKRQGQAGKSWHVDETYVKVQGKWCSLYRAIDHEGLLVASMLS